MIRTLGCYGLLNPQADIDSCLSDVKKAGFSGVYVFINADRWTQPPEVARAVFPWPWDAHTQVFDMTTVNPAYLSMVKRLTDGCFKRNLDLGLKFHTQYHLRYWNKFAALKQKLHPYFANNYHFDAGGSPQNEKDLKLIYDSITFPGPQYAWLKWKDINEPANKFLFSPANNFGRGIMLWVQTTIHQIATDFKAANLLGCKSSLFFCLNNEEIAGGAGDRSAPAVWLREQWVKEGLTPKQGSSFFQNINRQPVPFNAATAKELFSGKGNLNGITSPYGIKFGLGSLMEIHVDDWAEVQQYIDAGCTPEEFLFKSNDGADKKRPGFIPNSIKFWNAGGNDFVYDEGPGALPPWRWMANWKRAFPEHAQIPQH